MVVLFIMALFNRLFPSRKVTKSESSVDDDYKPFSFNKTQVRVLLFRECEWKGRKLLFDSSAFEDISSEKSTLISFKAECKTKNANKGINKSRENINNMDSLGVQCKMMSPDVILLGEMIFGSVAMNYKGMSLKVHILNAPQRLMCTKVYCNPGRRKCESNDNYTSSQGSISSNSTTENGDLCNVGKSTFCSQSYSNNIDPSSPCHMSLLNMDDHLSINWYLNKDDSGFCSELSSHSSIGCNCNYDSSPYFWDRDDSINHSGELYHSENAIDVTQMNMPSSLQWRLSHHLSTSLDNTALPEVTISSNSNIREHKNSRNSINSSTSENLCNSGKSIHNKRTKMGLAIVITLTEKKESQMLRFLMEHALLVEGALSRLRIAVQEGLCKPQSFLNNMSVATHEAAQWLVDLLTCPRISSPLWPILSNSLKNCTKTKIADVFVNDLCSLLCTMDTKDTYFFMSTLLTNILTFHLGWVNSVSPFNISSAHQQKELDFMSNYNPYNPLWAQLGELYGVIGTPIRISKTVVYGKENLSVIKKILNVLSYFIRCVEVKRSNIEINPISWENIDSLMNWHKSQNNLLLFNCNKNTSSEAITGDYIEMRTFSTNQDTFLKKKTFCQDTATNNLRLNASNFCDQKCSKDDKATLKKSSSCIFNQQYVLSSSNVSLICSKDSSLDSIVTLKPVTSSENQYLNNVNSNDCINLDSNTENSCLPDEEMNLNGIRTKVNKLCRVPTSAVLCHLNDVKECNSYESNVLFENKSNMTKAECQKPSRIYEQNIENKICTNDNSQVNGNHKGVIFVLGEDEVLIGLKDSSVRKPCEESYVDEVKCPASINKIKCESKDKEFVRSKSYPRDGPHTPVTNLPDRCSLQRDCCQQKPQCQHSKFKKHSGVKFEFDKYPQIVTNYMKSKNLELLDRHVIGKPGNLKIDCIELEPGPSIITTQEECDTCLSCSLNGQGLQTPSNASELEYTSDIPDQREFQYAKEKVVTPPVDIRSNEQIVEPKVFIKKTLDNTLIVNYEDKDKISLPNSHKNQQNEIDHLEDEIIELPLPSITSTSDNCEVPTTGYCQSLLGGITDHYVSDFVLQGGVGREKEEWEKLLRRDLTHQGGATCLLADVDDWSVRVLGSAGGGAGGMSALVASMLDTLPQMCHAKVPSLQCLAYIESKLQELCVRSKALAQLLIDKDFCDMDYLTKTLDLDPNDVPLLLAIASTHSPQVSLKYGVSYK